MAQSTEPILLLSVISIVGAFLTSIITVFLTSRQVRIKSTEAARTAYEYEARKRLYLECEPILFQLQQPCEGARMRISHMPWRINDNRFLTQENYLKEKDILEKSWEKPQAGEEEKEELLKMKLGWLSFPNYYMLSTIYQLLAPLAAFKILQMRLTTVDLELDPLVKTIYLLSKHLYLTFSAETDLAHTSTKTNLGDIDELPDYQGYDQGIAGYLDDGTEALIEHYSQPEKVLRIKTFGEFNKKYVMKNDMIEINGKRVETPFDRIYRIFKFFHPETKPVLWRILVEQLYLYNALKNVYKINGNKSHKHAIKALKDSKPIQRIPEDQRDGFVFRELSFLAVEKYLWESPDLKDLMSDEIIKSHHDFK
jgi:hypothetical protein